jgi:hypothetical protein
MQKAKRQGESIGLGEGEETELDVYIKQFAMAALGLDEIQAIIGDADEHSYEYQCIERAKRALANALL